MIDGPWMVHRLLQDLRGDNRKRVRAGRCAEREAFRENPRGGDLWECHWTFRGHCWDHSHRCARVPHRPHPVREKSSLSAHSARGAPLARSVRNTTVLTVPKIKTHILVAPFARFTFARAVSLAHTRRRRGVSARVQGGPVHAILIAIRMVVMVMVMTVIRPMQCTCMENPKTNKHRNKQTDRRMEASASLI